MVFFFLPFFGSGVDDWLSGDIFRPTNDWQSESPIRTLERLTDAEHKDV
jgi:hypothetical protein